jgi:hypothetical protein
LLIELRQMKEQIQLGLGTNPLPHSLAGQHTAISTDQGLGFAF